MCPGRGIRETQPPPPTAAHLFQHRDWAPYCFGAPLVPDSTSTPHSQRWGPPRLHCPGIPHQQGLLEKWTAMAWSINCWALPARLLSMGWRIGVMRAPQPRGTPKAAPSNASVWGNEQRL